MRRIRYTHLDVFSAQSFGGNQLVVCIDADSLDASEMQAIAREMNFSECTFILAPDDPARALCRVRIFTPGEEVPFAGHPTIGTTVALARAGRITPDHATANLELGVGPLAVEAIYEGAEARAAWMTQPLPTFAPWQGDQAALLDALGLDEAALRPDLPIERGSAGLPYVYIPLRDLAALAQARANLNLGAALAKAQDGPPTGVYLFVCAPGDVFGAPIRARMFAPDLGLTEDAATGSAAGPLGVYLARHGLITTEPDARVSGVVQQGVEMGRPSEIAVELTLRDGQVSDVRVGGAAVAIAEGEFLLPDKEEL